LVVGNTRGGRLESDEFGQDGEIRDVVDFVAVPRFLARPTAAGAVIRRKDTSNGNQ